MPHVVVSASPEIASRHAAGVIKRLLKRKPDAAFMLPTGSTPLRLYSLLSEAVASGQISFSLARSFNLDEYLGLTPDRLQSYRRFMHDNFFSLVDIKKNRTLVPDGLAPDPAKFCREYEAKVMSAGIDLAVLGIGRNGHLAFNEPGSSFDSATRVVDLTPDTITANSRFFSSPDEVPRQAITVGLGTIMRAKKIIVLAFGEDKAEAIRAALEDPASPDLPASVLQKHKHVSYILDREAAALLKKTELHPPHLGKIRFYSDFNLPRNKKIVFFAPHPDDASICAGAILSQLARHNEVHEIIVTTGHRAVIGSGTAEDKGAVREEEVNQEAAILGCQLHLARSRFYDNSREIDEKDLKQMRTLLKKIQPDIAFLPHQNDTHPTHIQSRKLALASLPHGTKLWSFETPWGLFTHSRFNAAFEFSEETMQTKLAAIRTHLSQLERTAFDDAALDISRFRRITLGEQLFSALGQASLKTQPYLELFHLSKW